MPEPFDLDSCLHVRTVGGELPRLQEWVNRRASKGVVPVGTTIVPLRPLDEEYRPAEPQFTYRLPGEPAVMVALCGSRTTNGH